MFLERLGGLSDAFWRPFGASWSLWEASWGAQNDVQEGSMFKAVLKCHFKTILEPSWARLGGRKGERLCSPQGGGFSQQSHFTTPLVAVFLPTALLYAP